MPVDGNSHSSRVTLSARQRVLLMGCRGPQSSTKVLAVANHVNAAVSDQQALQIFMHCSSLHTVQHGKGGAVWLCAPLRWHNASSACCLSKHASLSGTLLEGIVL
jgi:hypothetical protein